jgi:hypothetical protein
MEPSQTEVDPASAPLMQRIGGPSIAEIEKLIGELQAMRNFLASEGERMQREVGGYIDLTEKALSSIRTIFDTLAGWHQTGHPLREFLTRRWPAEDR